MGANEEMREVEVPSGSNGEGGRVRGGNGERKRKSVKKRE